MYAVVREYSHTDRRHLLSMESRWMDVTTNIENCLQCCIMHAKTQKALTGKDHYVIYKAFSTESE